MLCAFSEIKIINCFIMTEIKNNKTESIDKVSERNRPFSKLNFILMGCCGLMIVIGFLLMTGGGSSQSEGFNPEIFSTRRIVVGPTMAFLGFLCMAFAIIFPTKTKKEHK